ncbi:MAG: NADH-quinone oxidoreductase subunit [Planctomycetota bacterium]|nr:MAG: NADH-quinone oxidoreductase subunit [Planctomycetota bacterium]
MNEASRCLAAVPFLCLAGFLANGLLGRRLGRNGGAAVGVAAAIASFLFSIPVAREVFSTGEAVKVDLFAWIDVADLQVKFAFLCDRLSVIMLLIVTGVGSLIHLYSAGYMAHDASVPRYFSYLNLFMFSMLLLVLGDNLLLMFVGWEGVGLCSYLLIGFWFEDPEKAYAGRKAFIVNRIGDFGFALGLFAIFMVFHSFDYETIRANLGDSNIRGRLLSTFELGIPFVDVKMSLVCAITLALFLGATGKSAQIPLYVWLPDAMAGPTPVSALIHAATMVTSGIYMVCRLSHLFVMAPPTMDIIAGVGGATAVFAALMALAQNDIKKVLAYSTVSQLGLMFLALGTGGFSAGFFHVFTHAFFKALLFLGAGSVIHALSGEQDLRRMGGLKDRLPATFATMLIGTVAIAGIPPFAGFFSKDEILWRAWEGYLTGRNIGHGLILGLLGSFASALTAFYMFRLLTLAFLGAPRGSAEAHSHAHESPWTMTLPLTILAICSVAAGFLNVPHALHGSAHFSAWLQPVVAAWPEIATAAQASHHGAEIGLMTVSTLIAFGGSGFALWIYLKRPGLPAEVIQKSPGLGRVYAVIRDKFYIDEAYDRIVVRPVKLTAFTLWIFVDVLIIDTLINVAALIAEVISEAARRLQDGAVGTYAVWFLAGAMLLLGYFLFVLGAA